MKGKAKTSSESIRIEAYLLSEKAGHPAGMEHYFWTQAEAIVHARAAAVSVAVATAAAKRAKQPKVAAKPKPKAAVNAKVAARPKAETKPKTTSKPLLNAANGKEHQLPLHAEMAAPVRKRATKK